MGVTVVYWNPTPPEEGGMTRTILAAALLLGLVACGKRGSQETSSRVARARHPAATQPSTTQNQKRKGAARPDTARTKNPLTNN